MRLIPVLLLVCACSQETAPTEEEESAPLGCDGEPLDPIYEGRNPETGECDQIYDACSTTEYCDQPCPLDQYVPTWGACESACNALSESDCRDTEGCRLIYTGTDDFAACWATSVQFDQRPTVCEGLDAEECQQWDTCSAVHAGGEPGAFTACRTEGR